MFFFLKATESGQNKSKNKVVRKNVNKHCSEATGQEKGQDSAGSSKKTFFQFRSSKLFHLGRQHFELFYVKRNAEFNELMFFFSKSNRECPKIAKTKVICKNTNGRRSKAKG